MSIGAILAIIFLGIGGLVGIVNVLANLAQILDYLEKHPPQRLVAHTRGRFKTLRGRGEAQVIQEPISLTPPQVVEALPPPMASEPLIVDVPEPHGKFKGREDFLKQLRETFESGDSGPATNTPLVISAIGGMGKTRTAIEYSKRYRHEYQTILWASADTRDKLLSAFLKFASDLKLREADNKDTQRVVDAVKDWLKTNQRWLLIFDNVEEPDNPDEPEIVREFLPPSHRGHILITSRAASLERARAIELPAMEGEYLDDGVHLLLDRADIRVPTADDLRDAGEVVGNALRGLPLAIEQAGAYIRAIPSSPSEYLSIFEEHRRDLLRRGAPPAYTDEEKDKRAVATTWLVNFQKVQANRAAAELLDLCAFLDPDAIPEEILTEGAPVLGGALGTIATDQFKLNETYEALSRFSLIRRNPIARTLTIHRLVQDVIKDFVLGGESVIKHNIVGQDSQHSWAERAVRAVSHVFPSNVNKPDVQDKCRRLLPHAIACSALMKDYALASEDAVTLLNQAGVYLREQSRFKEAELLLRQAVAMCEGMWGRDDPRTAKSLDNLARVYHDQVLYRKSKQLYRRVVNIRQRHADSNPTELARSLNWLGLTYWYVGDRSRRCKEMWHEWADRLFQRALAISSRVRGPEDPLVTLNIRNNQALFYRSQGRYPEAIRINREVVEIRRRVLDRALGRVPQDEAQCLQARKDVAQSLQNLAVTYLEQKDASRYAEAEGHLGEALAIRREVFPPKHVAIARCLRYLGSVYAAQKKYEKAAECFGEAWTMWGDLLEDRSQIIEVGDEYEAVLRSMGWNDKAETIAAEVRAMRNRAAS